jgi:hypothetical protein
MTVAISYIPQEKVMQLINACRDVFYRVGQIRGCLEINEIRCVGFEGIDYIKGATEEICRSVEKIINMIETTDSNIS